jgi:hypothetical protein
LETKNGKETAIER